MSIFSTYSTGENRVTASVLAVIRSLLLDRIQRLLGALLEESAFELVTFKNQAKGDTSVPDALIQSSCRILIETKIARDAVVKKQIEEHLKRLDEATATEAMKVLLVITPDENRPAILDTLKDDRIAWASLVALDQAIDELLDDKYEVVSEREAFLLRELQSMLADEGLLASENDVIVVAARRACSEYLEIHAYICQPYRKFQPVSRVGFYSQNQVYPLVPKNLEKHDDVEMKRGHAGALGTLVNRLLDEGRRNEGEHNKVFLLSAPDSPDTLRLPKGIQNDLKTRMGKNTAFTMGQRYVSSAALLAAKTTSDLAEA
jgi:hypothetical protein